MRLIRMIAILGLLILILQATAHAVLKVGQKAPDFSGKTWDGKPVRLSALRGKVVIVDFWGPG